MEISTVVCSTEHDEDGEVFTAERTEIKRPKKYKVLLHNDDYTSMEFVIYVLRNIFYKGPTEAQNIMLRIHEQGIGICGIYTFEVAETKVEKVKREAKEKGYPLRCTMEVE